MRQQPLGLPHAVCGRHQQQSQQQQPCVVTAAAATGQLRSSNSRCFPGLLFSSINTASVAAVPAASFLSTAEASGTAGAAAEAAGSLTVVKDRKDDDRSQH
ncbi:hypothetical protein ACSSS7_006076 [Eimeria intestinalis]